MEPQENFALAFSKNNETLTKPVTKIDAKNEKFTEDLQNLSTNCTTEQGSSNKKESGINNDMAHNFGPSSRQEEGAPLNYFEIHYVPVPLDEKDDVWAKDRVPIFSLLEEDPDSSKIAAAAAQNDEDFEEHQTSYESCSNLSGNEPEEELCEFNNFLEPEARHITIIPVSSLDTAQEEILLGFRRSFMTF